MANPEGHVLAFAGMHDEKSLPFTAAIQHAQAHPENITVVTVSDDRRKKVLEGKIPEELRKQFRVAPGFDWMKAETPGNYHDLLKDVTNGEAVLIGGVHGMAKAGLENFSLPAHEIPTEVYAKAIAITGLSFMPMVRASLDFAVPRAGFMGLTFTEAGHKMGGYGPAITAGKDILTRAVIEGGHDLDKHDPPVRTGQLRTSFFPSNSSRAAGRGSGLRTPQLLRHFHRLAPLLPETVEGMMGDFHKAVGEMTLSFVNPNGPYRYTTAHTIDMDGGFHSLSPGIAPDAAGAALMELEDSMGQDGVLEALAILGEVSEGVTGDRVIELLRAEAARVREAKERTREEREGEQ